MKGPANGLSEPRSLSSRGFFAGLRRADVRPSPAQPVQESLGYGKGLRTGPPRVSQLVMVFGNDRRLTASSGRDGVKNGDAWLVTRLTAGCRRRSSRPDNCAPSLLLLVEVGQQAERALEHLRRDKAGGQALVDLQADQHRLPDGPGLDGRDPCGEVITIGVIGVG
jgi:hypothetical protein